MNNGFIFYSRHYDPYLNLALEEYLFDRLDEYGQILYLWQNDNTVVIGSNQNPYAECDIDYAKRYSIKIARRLTGGGAVFHDRGNLNFTFMGAADGSAKNRNFGTIVEILKENGVDAYIDGRNDILAYGKKISGNAFYEKNGFILHHGTILVSTDLSKMDVLSVDRAKFEEKGIASVRSRVANISSFNEHLTVEKIREGISEKYIRSCNAEVLSEDIAKDRAVAELAEKYGSDEWIFGKRIPADITISKRFPWGNFCAVMQINGDIIKQFAIYSDCLDTALFAKINKNWVQCPYSFECIREQLTAICGNDHLLSDILNCIEKFMHKTEEV